MYYTVETEIAGGNFSTLATLVDVEHVCELVRVLLRPTVPYDRTLRVTRHPEAPPKFPVQE